MVHEGEDTAQQRGGFDEQPKEVSSTRAEKHQAAELQQFLPRRRSLSPLHIPATLPSTSLPAIFHCQSPQALDVFLMVRHIKTEENAQITDI